MEVLANLVKRWTPSTCISSVWMSRCGRSAAARASTSTGCSGDHEGACDSLGSRSALVAAIIAVYRLLPVNNTTVALTLLLAILGISTWWGLAEATWRRCWRCWDSTSTFCRRWASFTIQDPQNLVAFLAFLVTAATASQLSARTPGAAPRRRKRGAWKASASMRWCGPGADRQRAQDHPRIPQPVVQEFGCRGAAFYYRQTDEVFRTGPESQPVTDHDLRSPRRSSTFPASDRRLGRARSAWAAEPRQPGAGGAAAFRADGARHRGPGRHHHRKGARAGGSQPCRSGAPERGAEIRAAGFAGARYQDAADLHQGRRHQPAGQAVRMPTASC
jgi:hypothetical protein